MNGHSLFFTVCSCLNFLQIAHSSAGFVFRVDGKKQNVFYNGEIAQTQSVSVE